MSDQEEFPGFIDDAPAKPKKVAPPPPAAAPSAPPEPAADEPLFKEEAPAKPKRSAPAPAPSAPAPAPAGDSSEADVKPGARKDLWLCPHCGAKNNPNRTTCRACGKSPDDAIEIPWHQKTPIRLGIAGGVVLLVVLGWLLTGGPPKLKPAGPESIDSAVRLGGSVGGSADLEGGKSFTARKYLAVSGRVLESQPFPGVPGVTTVVLGLGSKANDDELFKTTVVEFGGAEATVRGTVPTVVVHLLYAPGISAPTMTRGLYYSFSGAAGTLTDAGTKIEGSEGANVFVVQVREVD